MAASWMLAGRGLRPRRTRGRFGDEDSYEPDANKSPERNARDILRGLCAPRGVVYEVSPIDDEPKPPDRTVVSDNRRLSYLNALVKLLSRDDTGAKLGFTAEELLCCLRASLVHENSQVRAGTLRAIRYALHAEADVVAFNSLRLPYLVTRSLDVVLRNEMERIQALKVVRRLIRVGAAHCEPALARALVAVPSASPDDKDRMMRAYLAALCELGILNPALFIRTGGVTAITRAILDCQTPRIAESLCGVLLYLLNDPKTRSPARVDLRCLAAPYCDFHYRHGWMDKNRDEREMRFTCSRLSLLSILRSWPGLLHFCDPLNESGFRAIVDVLYLNQLEVRKAILELLYELLGLPIPEWTDELSVALAAVDPSDFQNSWRLNEGFVAAEGRSILPHLSSTGPDLSETHLALLLYCFLKVGLLDALVEVMITSDTFISVRAIVLLGQLLHLIHLLLPPETCNISPALPLLLSKASAMHPQALAAVAALQNLNSLLKSRPASNSLFLDHVVQCHDPRKREEAKEETLPKYASPKVKPDQPKTVYKYRDESLDLLNDADYEMEHAQRRSFGAQTDLAKKNESVLVKSKSVSSRTSFVVNKVVKNKKILNLFDNLRDGDSLIKDSNVLENKMGFPWDWNVIRAIIKNGAWNVEKVVFINALVNYFKPSSNRFSHADFQQSSQLHSRDQVLVALDLVEYLLSLRESESLRLLTLLFTDIRSNVAAIMLAKSAHDCLFSPQHMTNTMCQMYFLLIGRLCSTNEGIRIFKDTGLFESLLKLATTTHHSCYVKLIVSSLDYSLNSYPRQILAQTLRCHLESSRLYATQFLNVLLRVRQKADDLTNGQSSAAQSASGRESPMAGDEVDISDSSTQTFNVAFEECPQLDSWILELLIKQARDESKAVSLCALNILDEACSVPMYLNKLVSMKPKVKDLGDKGYLLWIRFAGTSVGFQRLADAGYIHRQIRYWAKQYNYRYTRLVDGEIHDCLTLLQKSEDGHYSRRHSSIKPVSCHGAPLPPHLYGQLVIHQQGVEMISKHGDIPKLLQRIKQGLCSTEQEIMDLKSALWACGHISTSTSGIELLMKSNPIDNSVFSDIVKLVQGCQVYSIRGTAFYVLGLIGSTYDGANVLSELGWLSVRHNRHERWPIIKDLNWLPKSDSEDEIYQNLCDEIKMDKSTVDTEISEHSDKTDHSSQSGNLRLSSGKFLVTSATMAQSTTEDSFDEKNANENDIENVRASTDKPERRIKCLTLPQRLHPVAKKHQRSLSESKTVNRIKIDDDADEVVGVTVSSDFEEDIRARLAKTILHMWPDSCRVRNNSGSSTSGVSSSDSVYGKFVYHDRFLTLSPIPSSSSLSAMKIAIPNRKREAVRRISLQNNTGFDVASSPPSQRDIFGYATLRYLSHYRRPTYSEANVDELISFINSDPKKISFSTQKEKSKSAAARYSRMNLLKYDWLPIETGSKAKMNNSSQYASEPEKVMENMSSPWFRLLNSKTDKIPTNVPRGQCYMGISMPRCLLDIFPSKNNTNLEDLSEANYLAEVDSIMLDIENNLHDTIKKNDDSNFNSSFSDLSIGNGAKSSSRIGRGRSRDRHKHDQLTCLYCSRLKPATEVKKISDLREAFFAGMDSPKPSCSGSTKSGQLGKSPAPTNSLPYASIDVSCGSPTSLDSNLSKLSDGNPNVVEEILKHAERMGNPFWHRQSKQALLCLKQKYSEAFQSICLYSEICKIVSQCTYRLNARRFLQELFLDLNFHPFYLEPQIILQNKEIETNEE